MGASALGDNELVAIVIGAGCRDGSAIDVANHVLSTVGGPRGLTRVSAAELQGLRGIGKARAAQLLAASELGRRTLLRSATPRERFTSPAAVAAYLMPHFSARNVEHFGLAALDAQRRLIKTALLTVGTLDCSVIHPREVFHEAIATRASGVVLFHNHPSGDPSPSHDDAELTWRMVGCAAGRVVGIEVLDHLVLADARYDNVFLEAESPRAAVMGGRDACRGPDSLLRWVLRARRATWCSARWSTRACPSTCVRGALGIAWRSRA